MKLEIGLFLRLVFLLSGILIINLWVPNTYAADVPIAANPVISRGVPAYTSDDCAGSSSPGRANDNDYSTLWRSCNAEPSSGTPVTLTYDLSGVASSERKEVILAWYADNVTGAYDHTVNVSNASNLPKDYTIEGNAAPGGTEPGSDWVILATITGNVYHSRQHQIDLTGYNWIRISVTASEGSVLNMDVTMNMDIHNVSDGVSDDWIFYGDSITMDGLQHTTNIGDTFSKQINAFNSTYFPIFESGGIGGLTSGDALSHIDTWLALFPGKFVALNYGTNDATSLVSGATYYSNMKDMVDKVLALNKVPIVPKIPWGCTANLTTQVSVLNAQIDQLYQDYPEIIEGPDLYTYYNNNQDEISGDCIHPTSTDGYTAYRTLWVEKMEEQVYSVPVLSIDIPSGNYSAAQNVTLTSTKSGKIYYSLDGSIPTSSSQEYINPLSISSTGTLRAIAIDQAGNQSDLASAVYTFGTTAIELPVIHGVINAGPPSCSSTTPTFVPDLFQINASGHSAKLYFTTSKENVDGYQISYGLNSSADMYGYNFAYNGSEWILGPTISGLQPNVTYYFKVRAANSCTAGNWSPIRKITTKKDRVISMVNSGLPASEQAEACEYIVQSGDSLWGIAQNILGDGRRFNQLTELNSKINITKMRVGTKLKTC